MKMTFKHALGALAATTALTAAGAAMAATNTVDDLVVTGTITDNPASIDYWQFDVTTPGTVTIDVLSRNLLPGDGGSGASRLDSQIYLFDYDNGGDLGMLGTLVGANDDGYEAGYGDGSNHRYDSFLSLSLGAGSYVLSISDFLFTEAEARLGMDTTGSNFPGTFADYQITFTGIDVAPVPLPAALPLMLAGMGALGFVGRRRSRGKTSA